MLDHGDYIVVQAGFMRIMSHDGYMLPGRVGAGDGFASKKTVPALYQCWCFTAPTIVALQKVFFSVNHVDNRVYRNSMLQNSMLENVIRKSSSENNCQRRTYLGHLRIWLRPTLPSSPHNFPLANWTLFLPVLQRNGR